MRASISHKFGRDYQMGTLHWHESPHSPGTYGGNPSLSVVVSQYMVSLRRRKVSNNKLLCKLGLTQKQQVRAGEVVTSARAIDEATMKKLHQFNIQPTEYCSTSRKRKAEHPEDWAGYTIRMMLQLLYVTSMLCLLRYDEALRIQWSDVTLETLPNGVKRVKLELSVRKTHQNGGE